MCLERKSLQKVKLVDQNFSYNSGDNDEWETIDSLRELVKKYVDPNFKV